MTRPDVRDALPLAPLAALEVVLGAAQAAAAAGHELAAALGVVLGAAAIGADHELGEARALGAAAAIEHGEPPLGEAFKRGERPSLDEKVRSLLDAANTLRKKLDGR